MRYIIASGWWCTESTADKRAKLIGDDYQRTSKFHSLWHYAVTKFCNPEEIIIIDSASPIKPKRFDGEKWLEMSKNFGHSTNHIGKFSGVMRSFMMSLVYCYSNDYDYWVYIEQDCLIFGNGIIEEAISKMNKSIMLGDGHGTPQPIQQSFMIVAKNAIPQFLFNLQQIEVADFLLSPEEKFVIASNIYYSKLPIFFQRIIFYMIKRHKILKKIFLKLLVFFRGYDLLPFGSGRSRPISFSDSFFYFQHGIEVEFNEYLKKIECDTYSSL